MAKRTIHECDLTKQEFDPDQEKVFTISVAKKGQKGPMKYEICAAAAEKLLAQLNSSEQLDENWSFSSKPKQVSRGRSTTFEDLEQDTEDDSQDDTKFVARKRAELVEAGIVETEPRKAKAKTKDGVRCTHLNKGRIETTLKNKKRFAFRACRECGEKIEEQTASDRKSYMGGKPPAGVKLRDLGE